MRRVLRAGSQSSDCMSREAAPVEEGMREAEQQRATQSAAEDAASQAKASVSLDLLE